MIDDSFNSIKFFIKDKSYIVKISALLILWNNQSVWLFYKNLKQILL